MPYTEWNDRFNIGNRLIDGQHRQLLEIMNDLYDAPESSEPAADVDNTINRMMLYAEKHFWAEETLMLQNNYPEHQDHRALHLDFIRQTLEYRQRCNSGDSITPENMFNFLFKWLINHILEEDRKYIPFLVENQKENV